MKALLLFFVFTMLALSCFSQISNDYYFIEFTDKNESPYLISQPEVYLSQKAIERRTKYNIPVSQQDFPVNPAYSKAVKDIGVKYIQQTKWLNGIVIKTSETSKLDLIAKLPFVKKVVKNKELPSKMEEEIRAFGDKGQSDKSYSSIDYGQAFSQISMVGGIPLHDMGFLGHGLSIAVLDGGFIGTNFMDAFDSLRANNQIKATLNLVGGGTYVYQGSSHGSNVLSVLAANIPGVMVGTAPKANYYLIRSEDTNGESLLEEYNWVTAAEYADSAGVDIITTSLSYALSSNPSTPLDFSQLDGNTAPATLAAEIACSKGMIVIASAGNNGENQNWPHVGFPADGDSVFTIGAVDAHGIRAAFSSPGPTFDDRIKPDVMAMGEGTTVMKADGTLGTGDGTSFSTPVIAGLTACLWQAYPEMRNMEILSAIRKGSSMYFAPDYLMGYGIPDFSAALNSLTAEELSDNTKNIIIAPNPFSNEFMVRNLPATINQVDVSITDVSGKTVYATSDIPVSAGVGFTIRDLSFLPQGIYLLKINTGRNVFLQKLIKINNQ